MSAVRVTWKRKLLGLFYYMVKRKNNIAYNCKKKMRFASIDKRCECDIIIAQRCKGGRSHVRREEISRCQN